MDVREPSGSSQLENVSSVRCIDTVSEITLLMRPCDGRNPSDDKGSFSRADF